MNNEVKLNPEHHDDHLQGGDGEDAEKGRDKVQHNIQNIIVITYM